MVYQTTAFDVHENTDPSVHIILDAERFERLMNFLRTRRVVVFDYETDGLAYYQGKRAVGVGFGAWDDQGRLWKAYVPWGHKTGERQLDLATIGTAIGDLLGDASITKVAHNFGFEEHFSRAEGWDVRGPRVDTLIAAMLYDENEFAKLEARAVKDLGRADAYDQAKGITKIVAKLARFNRMKVAAYKDRYGYSEVPVTKAGVYCCQDIDHTAALYQFYCFTKRVPERAPRIWRNEHSLIRTITDLEEVGLRIDVPYLEGVRSDMRSKKEALSESIHRALYGHQLNWSSDDQLRDYMVNYLGLRWDKLTKAGRKAFRDSDFSDKFDPTPYLSVEGSVLSEFATQYPVLQHILDWRAADKIDTTYTTSVLDRLDSNNFLHGSMRQLAANTGRMSCIAGHCLVRTKRGEVPIRDVVVGDYVWTHKGRWRRVTHTISQGVKPTLDLTFTTGRSLMCTPDHRLLSFDGGWWEAGSPGLYRLRGEYLSESGFRSIGIVARQPWRSVEVFDLTVDEDRSFAVSGIFAHNCASPNYQNFPSGPLIRTAFTVVAPGWVRLCLDYSQVELRVLAHYSQDPIMLDTYLRGANGGDIHEATRSEVEAMSGKPFSRRGAKVVNFGLCLAYGSMILTQQDGEVPIQDVKSWHLLWDGVGWVRHEGLICRGEKEVITHEGLTATPEHKVYTQSGRLVPIENFASGLETERIAIGAYKGRPVQFDAGGSELRERANWQTLAPQGPSSVQPLWAGAVGVPGQLVTASRHPLLLSAGEVPRPQSKGIGAALRFHGAALSSRYSRFVTQLQGAWHRSAFRVARALHSLGFGEVARLGFQGTGSGSYRQQWALRAEQHAARNQVGELEEQTAARRGFMQTGAPTGGEQFVSTPNNRAASVQDLHAGIPKSVLPEKPELQSRQEEAGKKTALVYDLLNAGPRHRFTANGKIVSNSYGLTAVGMADQTGLPKEECETLLDAFFARFGGIDKFRRKLWSSARRNLGTIVNAYGRVRTITDILPTNPPFRQRSAERRLVGSMIQGTAADIMKEATLRVDQYLKQSGTGARLCNLIHDDLHIDVPLESAIKVAQDVRWLMEQVPEMHPVPITAGCDITTTNWAEKEELVCERCRQISWAGAGDLRRCSCPKEG